MRRCLLLALGLLSAWLATLCGSHLTDGAVPEYRVQVVHTYPHDRTAYTQGLEYHDGLLYEGTGLNGRSRLRVTRLETGELIKQVDLPEQYFGEGITVIGGRIDQLTWQNHVGLIYNQRDFRLLSNFSYPGEGWGLTNDGKQIFMSDGTPEIRCLDPKDLREVRRVMVHDGGERIELLNELECVRGEIFANVWHTDRIARISPSDGKVVGWIDAAGLLGPQYKLEPEAVLNGIAYDGRRNRLFLTGKLWPQLFEVRVVRK